MSILQNTNEIQAMRESGKRLAFVMERLIEHAKPGVVERELDELAEQLIREGGDEPAFKGYTPDGAIKPFPATLCLSVNSEVVHGIPNDNVLKKGDIVKFDLGLRHNGLVSDMARTIIVGGEPDERAKHMLRITREALDKGIKAAVLGAHIGDISSAIQSHVADSEFSIVEELGGHGVGRRVHEEPLVPNVGTPGSGIKLVEGMALALEPIVNEGKPHVELTDDGYTITTTDSSRSAHFEDTIIITKNGPEIVTRPSL